MNRHVCLGLVACLALVAPVASGGLRYTNDLLYDYAWQWVDRNQGLWQGYPEFEIVKLGSEVKNGKLYFGLLQDLPKAGAMAKDSYSGDVALNMSPGDLVIVVGSRDPFAPPSATVQKYGLALTTHANVVPQKYPNPWKPVVEGRLYQDALFATGTLENYQELMKALDPTDVFPRSVPPYRPEDPDNGNPFAGIPDDQINSYPTLIMDYSAELLNVSSVLWQQIQRYDPIYNEYYPSFLITGWVDMAAIGLNNQMTYSLFYAPECGNDGAVHSSVIPEPSTLSLLAAALGILRLRARRR